jgi:pimeloyl-ACP methyl ester carboxylesterase
MPVIERDDATLWYEHLGDQDGAAVLLIHGGLFDPMTGERFWIAPGVAGDLVAAGYRVLVPDRRFSAGRTSADFAVHTWDVEVADLAAVLDDTGVERACVVTGSNGCSVAALLALAHPARVATLVLCWPPTRTTAAFRDTFERSAAAVEASGTAAYLDELRRNDVPRPGEERPGFPFGFALLRDRRAAATFLARSGAEAARVIRATAAALLPGDPMRGMTPAGMQRLDRSGIPTFVMPAEPEDPYHPRSAALALAGALPSAVLARGHPVTPSRFFPDYRAAFAQTLVSVFAHEPHS